MITQNIKVDVNIDHKIDPIICRIGEQNSRVIRFECVNYVDDIAEDVIFSTDNPTAQLRIVKPDNTFVIVNAVRAEPTDRVLFDVILPAEAAQVSGLGYYDFRIYDSALAEPGPTDFLYTASGRFIVDDDMLTDEMIASVASVNGLVFPDDFLTSADLTDYVRQEQLEDYSTTTEMENYVSEQIGLIPSPLDNYSTIETVVGKWIDGRDVYMCVYDLSANPKVVYATYTNTNIPAVPMQIIDARGIHSDGTGYVLDGYSDNGTLSFRGMGTDTLSYIIIRYVKV